MPAAPEVGHAQRGIRAIEVFREAESHHASQADRHVRIAREIEIQLKGVGNDAAPCEERREFVGRKAEDAVGENAKRIGEQQLLRQAEREPVESGEEALDRMLARLDLLSDIVVTNDGAGDQLREQEYIQGTIEESARRHGAALETVDQIADAVEGNEGDTEQERNMGRLDMPVMQAFKRLDNLDDDEVQILREYKRCDVEHDSGGQHRFLHPRRAARLGRDHQGYAVIDKGPGNQEHDIDRLAPGEKQDACRQRNVIADLDP